ncbi:50S ribosomal protein L24 [Brumimicrobium salinarum]|uniref:Large ribosomal subunit protein uL24 n=1 Tax=Brumimicrobium salinarum TaxID=2058658 RepID=A0A2I0R3S3_9FLAO|nr:50S ribosomal protein L24 [Brumimicrobium salinarum]PKR81222.1 50S ribosomal protein L24 [Brumimicrobium salinarum]
MQKKLHIKVDDTVKVISGVHRGQEGKVLSIDRKKERVLVEGINVVKRHAKPDAANPQGGIVEKEAGLHISNLMLVHNNQPTKVGRKLNKDGKLVRFAKKTGEEIK